MSVKTNQMSFHYLLQSWNSFIRQVLRVYVNEILIYAIFSQDILLIKYTLHNLKSLLKSRKK